MRVSKNDSLRFAENEYMWGGLRLPPIYTSYPPCDNGFSTLSRLLRLTDVCGKMPQVPEVVST